MNHDRYLDLSMIFLVVLLISSLVFFDFNFQGLVFSNLEEQGSFNLYSLILFVFILIILLIVFFLIRKKVNSLNRKK
ncbi:MAG: hypothetical protein WC260_01255 [Candidatus Pacearchaeota archaeon]